MCEVGRAGETLQGALPDLPFLGLDTEESEHEVFWLPAEALAASWWVKQSVPTVGKRSTWARAFAHALDVGFQQVVHSDRTERESTDFSFARRVRMYMSA